MATCMGSSGQTGTKYTYAQLEGLWINANGSKALAPVMAAIAMAESGGCSAAYNASGATGLWQILGAVNPADQSGLYNPQVNAQEAVLKYKSQGLTAWQTYTNGAYKAFVSGSTTPDTNVPGTAATDTSSSGSQQTPATCVVLVPNPVSGIPIIGDLISSAGVCLFTKTEARALIGGLILGAGVMATFVGLSIMIVSGFSHTKAGQAAGRAVGGAAELGGAAATLAGMPEVGAVVAGAGHAVRSHSRSGQTQAGKYAQRKRTSSRAAASEDAELKAKGASDISTARKPAGTLTKNKPGRVISSTPGPGRYQSNGRPKPATRAEAGF